MDIRDKEVALWEAAVHQDVEGFRNLVADEAVMVCGGYRCTGREYAGFIQDFGVTAYCITFFEELYHSNEIIQIHYVLETKVARPEDADLSGTFHITSTWKNSAQGWKLVFNMDARIPGR